jgi:pimeloyl-ACP methyl ester carboxylesterase
MIVCRLAVCGLIALSVAACATLQPEIAEDQRFLPYVEPGVLVDVGERRIHLHCAGTESGPTVVLMAGLGSWSPVWYKVQPEIARQAHVCTFDRAGYGFSDPPPRPQILSDSVEDLRAALHAGNIPGPYVLVGHSLGGVEARLYAQRWPGEVIGMVLVDTSLAGEGLIYVEQPGFDEVMGWERYASNRLHCAFLAMNGPLPTSSIDYPRCSLALPRDTPAKFRKNWWKFFTADYAATQVSLMSSLYTHRYDSVDERSLGSTPLVVLSAENSWEAAWNTGSAAVRAFNEAYAPILVGRRVALARLSTRGVHRIVRAAGHEIQLDQPEAVVGAVSEVLRQLH